MRRTNLSGHALRGEGAAYQGSHEDGWDRVRWNTTSGTGIAVCECGETSPVLDSGGARRRWHSAHKDQVWGAFDMAPGV